MNEIEQLRTIWKQLDQVDGEFYNAKENLAELENIPPEILESLNRVDITLVTSVKNEVENALLVRGATL